MASGAHVKMVAVGMMLAIMFIAVANATGESFGEKSCFHKTDDVPVLADCICSKNCACAGNCILNGGATANEIKKCFVECVLKNDCNCKDGGQGAAQPDLKA